MSTLQENLDRIKKAKSAIKDAIIQKGIDVTDTEKIETYADKILQIKSGGGTEIPEFDPDGPLTFYRLDDIGDSYVSLGPNALSNIEYSTDKTTWKTYTSKQKIKLGKGEYVQFKCNSTAPTSNGNKFYTDGGLYNLYGKDTSINSLNKDKTFKSVFSLLNIVDASNFTLDCNYSGGIRNKYESSFSYCILLTELPKLSGNNYYSSFMYMFQCCTSLKRIPNNYLQNSSNLYDKCYSYMFNCCTGLTTLPSNLIQATTMAMYCCGHMFNGCTGLTTLPSNLLPTTTLESNCYDHMFNGCTGLTTLPSNLLPATTLESNCYSYMFNGCTGLTTLPSNLLPATTLASNCYSYMFNDCTGLTTLPSNLLPATKLASNCYDHMFNDCTGLTTLPALPATTLARSCYYYMFGSCTSLVKTPDGWYLPAQTTYTYSCSSMFEGCSKLQKMAVAYSGTITSLHWQDWLYNVSRTGTLYYSKNQKKENIQSIVPSGWTLVQSLLW